MSDRSTQHSPLLLRGIDGSWQAPETTTFGTESELQQLVAEHPSLLPSVSPDAVAVREFPTAAGPLDVCVVDADGTITLVECKLASNPEVRRKIVGQVLDYAARIWKLDVTEFDQRWKSRSGGTGILGEVDRAEQDINPRVDAIATALERGEFNLVLAVDEINEPLRRLVEYLNGQTSDSTSVLAIEFRYFRQDEVEILVPSVFGADFARGKEQRRDRTRWSVDEYVRYIQLHDADSAPAIERLLGLMSAAGLELVGTKSATPSLVTQTVRGGKNLWPLRMQTEPTAVEVNFHWMRSSVSVKEKTVLAEALSAIPGSPVDPEALAADGFARKPRFTPTVLSQPGAVETLAKAIGVLLEGSRPHPT